MPDRSMNDMFQFREKELLSDLIGILRRVHGFPIWDLLNLALWHNELFLT